MQRTHPAKGAIANAHDEFIRMLPIAIFNNKSLATHFKLLSKQGYTGPTGGYERQEESAEKVVELEDEEVDSDGNSEQSTDTITEKRIVPAGSIQMTKTSGIQMMSTKSSKMSSKTETEGWVQAATPNQGQAQAQAREKKIPQVRSTHAIGSTELVNTCTLTGTRLSHGQMR